jgi:hypothetical protein
VISRVSALLSSGLLLLMLGCSDDGTGPATPMVPAGVMPDFSLLDVNPESPTQDQPVSPRQFLGSISAYYFGSAT